MAESATVAQNDGAVSDGSASAADSATSCQWHHIGADAVISNAADADADVSNAAISEEAATEEAVTEEAKA